MRREDKRLMPPKLKLNLPDGFYVSRLPGLYLLYWTNGLVHQLIRSFLADAHSQEIEEAARKRQE